MSEPIKVTYQWELTPHYGITHYSSDIWCPHCNYMIHLGDEIEVGQEHRCRGCGQQFKIGNPMEKQPIKSHEFMPGATWIVEADQPMRGQIETRAEFVARNLTWWRECRHLERRRRTPHYQQFLELGRLWSILDSDKTLAEVGPGPFGGMIQQCRLPARKKYFIDYILRELVDLTFIKWPVQDCVYVHAAAEAIPLPDDEVDILISCNTLDHGWDVYQALRECIRVSRRCALSFDCRGDSEYEQQASADDKDHPQLLRFDDIETFLHREFGDHMALATFDSNQKEYPVIYILVNKDA